MKNIQESEYFGIFDYLSMYLLNYVYKHDTASFYSISRTLFFYQIRNESVLKGGNKNSICNCDKECIFDSLQEFTNENTYAQNEEMLVDNVVNAIFTGNLGLVHFLIKFGLMEFPAEVNEKWKKMFKFLVFMFNTCSKPVTMHLFGMEISVQFDELLNQMKEKDINIRRSLLIFCVLTIVSEYKMYDLTGVQMDDLKFYAEQKKHLCLRKIECINLYIQTTTELNLTFKDIENFTEVFLNPFLTAEIGNSFMETCRKLLDDSHNYYNPRSLKNLSRLKVRSTFRNSMSIPEQVNELQIAVTLKEFINFHGEGFWNMLVTNHLNLSFQHELNPHAPEIEDAILRAIGYEDAQELEDGNLDEYDDHYEYALEILKRYQI